MGNEFNKIKEIISTIEDDVYLLRLYKKISLYVDGGIFDAGISKELSNINIKEKDRRRSFVELYIYKCLRSSLLKRKNSDDNKNKLVFLKNYLYIKCVAVGVDFSKSSPEISVALTDYQLNKVEQYICDVYAVFLKRTPSHEEISIWNNNVKNHVDNIDFFNLIKSSDEARQHGEITLSDFDDFKFLKKSYIIILNRGITAREIEYWMLQLKSYKLSRKNYLINLIIGEYDKSEKNIANEFYAECAVLGTGLTITNEEWVKGRGSLKEKFPSNIEYRKNKFTTDVEGVNNLKISAIASLYKGAEFIESFLKNITSQIGFNTNIELIIVDASSPEGEFEIINKYMKRFENIRYIRTDTVIGIYEAWNIGVKMAKGKYLTNTNLDDLRRSDSLMLQASILDQLKYVDVVYQDLYFTYDPFMSFEDIANIGVKTKLPIIGAHNMMQFNSPHNAPMWRADIHKDVGYFNEGFKSAGDYEFWIRALIKKKNFFKINDPHVVYYQNPKGISTNPNTKGVLEAREISKVYFHQLMPVEVGMSDEEFVEYLDVGSLSSTSEGKYNLIYEAMRKVSIVDRVKS